MIVRKVKTADNSYTLFSQKYNQNYHSINGAVTESSHIFIKLGLRSFENRKIRILEIGYGTGLNAILSYCENVILKNEIFYQAIDIFPIELNTLQELGYVEICKDCNVSLPDFAENWDSEIQIGENFILKKQKCDLLDFFSETTYDLIYFDAFSPDVQPEMWTESIFKKLAYILNPGGILVTYCSKGIVKQNMRAAGFVVKRYKGPPGKHHVIRATKL